MYTQRVILHPMVGKGRELRALLEERVKTMQANGVAVALAVGVSTGAEGNPYVLNIRHADLAAYEAFRRRNQADPVFAAHEAKRDALLRQPIAVEVYDTVVPPNRNVALKAPYFTQRSVLYPALGNAPALRALQEEQIRKEQAAGQRAQLQVSVYGAETQTAVTIRGFQDLAALDAWRARNQADEGWQAHLAKVNSLVQRPARVTLSEVLIAAPS